MSCILNLLDLLEGYAPISADLRSYLSNQLHVQAISKGEPLFSDLRHASRTWMLCSGLLKSTYTDDSGKQIVSRFWQEGDIVLSKNRAVFEPGERITTVETSIVLYMDAVATEYVLDHFSLGHLLARKIYFNDAKQREFRAKLMQIPPSEAYELFCQAYPAERMLLQDIAAFLNIRPYSLSRIRARRR
ncbi:Crp/Fnr family transcriptional regulator [Dyadobacter psychrophilus]|uniref:cAMP-binding domain of CRP or a regulatory subunit of cAMP-dependent protein kinases n=1 Tax=Dyadobacter psychrophilus TaxID=651661 RepID=A0A1T5HD05_9BACT|nr:Crp/Fnr family transcriptional regulator [Dyadobacter psychrophilus]SKC18542.1 cAMP-binding domain of CRP or a regulatory subunit of cAMP-dependent protein kinases [Dyadobacter psychrophilus]